MSFHLSSCTSVYVDFHCLDVFNVRTRSFFYIHISLETEFQGKNNSRQGKSKIFVEDKSDSALTTDRKTKNNEVETVMQSMY